MECISVITADGTFRRMVVQNVLWKVFRRILFFGDYSSLHGLRYVTEERRSWFCRIFWLIALVTCAWALLNLLAGAIRSAREEALSFTPDTSRIHWQTAFPAVTVCEKYRYHDTLKRLNELYPEYMSKLDYNYKKMFADMCYGENSCELCTKPCDKTVNCSVNFRSLADEVRRPCASLIHDCKWLGRPVDCCTYFLPLDSDSGTCYSFNTLQSGLSGTVPIFKSNISTGPGYLSFFIYRDLEVYVHGADDIPWVKIEPDMQFEAADSVDFIFRVIDMTNDPLVQSMDMEIRKCRFPSEMIPSEFGKSFQMYGYSTCVVTCETELIYKRCQCIHHLRHIMYKDKLCNFTGLGCLAAYAAERKRLSPEAARDLCKHCLPSCEEIELTKVYLAEYEEEDGSDSRVDIRMVGLPSIQYRRNVVRSKLDLVVSIGGLAGLFFGASLLSIVEAIYFLCVRPGAYRK